MAASGFGREGAVAVSDGGLDCGCWVGVMGDSQLVLLAGVFRRLTSGKYRA